MSYTNVFGGNTIYPSDVSYLSIALSVDTPLEWPLESSGTEDPAARIIDVDPTASSFSVILPDATLTGAGQTILFNNIDGTFSFFVKDYAGNTLATVTAGTQWQVYLAATTTAAGTWRVFRYGASTATVQPSALAGQGLTTIGSQLAQSLPVRTFTTTPVTVSATANRAEALVWIDSGTNGAGTFNLPTAATAGNNFFIFVRNSGVGDLTIDPSGSELINGALTLVLSPNDSATVITDGTKWYTIGLGKEAVFAFDYTSISVTGGTVTLSGSQLNRIAYKFVGTLTSNCTIVVPATIQQYWINNATTGSFTLSVKTASGTATQVNQGAKGIYYCDGTNMVLASDPTTLTTPIGVSQGGTGGTTPSSARSGIGITTFGDSLVTAADATAARGSLLAAASGANSDITSLTGLTTALSAPQGGTGQSSYAVGDLLYASTTTALSKLADVATGNALISGGVGAAPSWAKIGLATHVSGTLPTANGGTNLTSFTSGGAVYATSTSVLTTGTLPATAGGTGQASYAVGDLLYASTTTALSKLADVAVNNVLLSGGVGAAPAYGKVGLTTHVSGTLPTANGGTGSSSGALTNCTADGTNAVGYRNVPQSGSDKTTSYPLATTDVGKFIGVGTGGSITIPDAVFSAGDIISLFNNTSAGITITCSITTAYIGGVNTDRGTMTLATRGVATVLFISGTVCVVNGNVS